MAMKPACIQSVNAAAGRTLSDAEIKAIDDRISSTMKALAVADPAKWAALPMDQRVLQAATQAMQDIQAQAARKVANVQRQVLAGAAVEQRVQAQQKALKSTRARALVEVIDNAGHYIAGVKRQYVAGMMDLVEAARSGQGVGAGKKALMFLFDAENPQMTKDIVSEIFGNTSGSTSNTLAKDGAKAWLDVIESMRTRFNAAGGDVGKLLYGYLPQPHDAARVRAAGADAWASKTMPLLDRKRYVNESGARMSDAEVTSFLKAAYETIATEGLNKVEPGQFAGSGAKANKGSESRQIHFKDGESYLAYMGDYGRGTMYDAMVSHIGAMARDIGLVEQFGPNPNAQFKLQNDLAVRADGGAERAFLNQPQAYWDIVSGVTGTPGSAHLAQIGQDIRNIQTFGKLAGAVISSITDLSTLTITTGFNKLSYWDLFKNIGKQADGDTRAFLTQHGVIAESMIGDLNRWAGENLRNTWSGRLANSTMKLSLMNAWTDTLRRGFAMTMMQGLAKLSQKSWANLTDWDRAHLERKGITEADWAVVAQAKLTDFEGGQFLTPEAIKAADIQTARPADLQRIKDDVAANTQELTARNAQDQQWIKGRLDKFDDARDALNRQVKEKHGKRLAANEKATEPMLERMALLDAQREAAQLQADMEADFNRFSTQDDVRRFLNAVEDGASADITDVAQAKPAVRGGLESAEAVGRRYGIQKGKLDRRMQEIQNRIGEMDREAGRATNRDAKAAQAKADDMAQELKDFVQRSQERQKRRQAVIDRLQRDEAPRMAAEAERIKNEVVAKVLGFITDESEYAVLNPDTATRAIQTWGGQQSGTGVGELARLTMQFKSFPIAMISRHWRRMLEGQKGLDGAPAIANKAAYGAALVISTTALGAIVFQAKQVKDGKDPVAMNTAKFWTRAAAQGGGAGFLGDILLGDTTDDRGQLDSLGRLALGPTFGSAADFYELTKGNIDEKLAGKDTHAGAEALKFAKGHLPYVNLWYGKAALDHLLLQGLQENLSPGYLQRMKDKARKDWGQGYWWQPGEATPDRSPDFSKAL